MRMLWIWVLVFVSGPIAASEVEEFLESYVDSYSNYLETGDSNEVAKVVRHLNEPLLQVPPKSAPFVAKDNNAITKNFTGFMTRVRGLGVRKIEWESVSYRMIGESHALSSNVAKMLDEKGKVVRRSAGIYSLYKFSDGWKIVMIQPVSPENSFSL